MSLVAARAGLRHGVAIAAACVVVAALLPVIYLFVRGVEGGETTWRFLDSFEFSAGDLADD